MFMMSSSVVTWFIYRKARFLKCEDGRFMGCLWGRIWWACEQVNEFMDKAKRIPSYLRQSQRSDIGDWAGLSIIPYPLTPRGMFTSHGRKRKKEECFTSPFIHVFIYKDLKFTYTPLTSSHIINQYYYLSMKRI